MDAEFVAKRSLSCPSKRRPRPGTRDVTCGPCLTLLRRTSSGLSAPMAHRKLDLPVRSGPPGADQVREGLNVASDVRRRGRSGTDVAIRRMRLRRGRGRPAAGGGAWPGRVVRTDRATGRGRTIGTGPRVGGVLRVTDRRGARGFRAPPPDRVPGRMRRRPDPPAVDGNVATPCWQSICVAEQALSGSPWWQRQVGSSCTPRTSIQPPWTARDRTSAAPGPFTWATFSSRCRQRCRGGWRF